MKRSISRVALAIALSVGAVGTTAAFSPAHAQLKISKGFQQSAVALQTKVNEAKENATVQAASDRAREAKNAMFEARDDAAEAAAQGRLQAARAEVDTAGGGLLATLESAIAAIEKEDDRMFAGQMALNIGQMMSDAALQKRGIDMMLQSGLLPAEDQPKYYYYSGALGYEAGDYAGARTSLQKAIDMGYTGDNVGVTLSEAYIRDGKFAEGLAKLDAALKARKAAGLEVTDAQYFRGLGVAANNQLEAEAFEWALKVLENSPRPDFRKQAYRVLRASAPFTPEEELDLLRLMQRSDGFSERVDYLAYLQMADARRRPGEVRSVIETGVDAGLLNSSDASVAEVKSIVDSRYDSVLKEIERDSAAARADTSGSEALAIADIYLGYRKSAAAEDLYRVALEKGGIDANQALTGLAIALADQGKNQEAIETFNRISDGNRSAIARAWIAYLAAVN